MKKVLLAGTALVGAALIASPAQAQIKLELGGHFSGYGVYVDQDNEVANTENFEFRRNTEIHVTGETTLDNGLTVGFHTEAEVENLNGNNESYAYFAGTWGRVNFGNEDGAAYLLQVAAPSADANVDGLRTTISSIRTPAGFTLPNAGVTLDYQHADFGNQPTDNIAATPADRLTYLTPKFNGFQAGVSYAPNANLNTGIAAPTVQTFADLMEVAARWDGQFEGVGLSVGAGYSTASEETGVVGTDDFDTWNVGANLAWSQFSFGAAYKDTNNGLANADTKTWVVGAAWDNGPYHAGISYLDRDDDAGVLAATAVDSTKITVGGGYTFGPGMTFRGAVAFGDIDGGASGNEDFTQVTLGTDIRF